MGSNLNETISSFSTLDDSERYDKLNSGDEHDRSYEANVIAKQKKKQVSIDVTKALMILGFSSWSTLEEGIERNNFKEMNIKLNGVLEQLQKDRREYLALINATKAINLGLYQKMSSANDAAINRSRIAFANVKRTGKQKINEGYNIKQSNVLQVSNNDIDNNSSSHNIKNNDRSKNLNVTKSPRRCKSATTTKKIQKLSKKAVQKAESLPSTSLNQDDENGKSDHDEQDVAITWAHSVLLKEFNRRCDLRHQNKAINKRVNHKVEAFQKFKKLQEEQKKKDVEKEAKGETIYKALESNKPEYDTDTNIDNKEITKENELEHNSIHGKSSINIKNEVEKEELNNHKTQIVSLQDQIRNEKDRGHISMVSGFFVSDTEKEKIKEAKKVLRRLDKVAEVKKQKAQEDKERTRQKKRKEEEKQRLAKLRKILCLKVVERENEVMNDNATADINTEGDDSKNTAEELQALEEKANAVKTMWKKKPAAKSSLKRTKEGSCKGLRKSLGSQGEGSGKPSILKTVKLLIAENSGQCIEDEFEEYVQEQVKQQGFVLTEEEEKMVQDAIARTFSENKHSGVDLDDSEVEDALEV